METDSKAFREGAEDEEDGSRGDFVEGGDATLEEGVYFSGCFAHVDVISSQVKLSEMGLTEIGETNGR